MSAGEIIAVLDAGPLIHLDELGVAALKPRWESWPVLPLNSELAIVARTITLRGDEHFG
jgi:hypothetical protein